MSIYLSSYYPLCSTPYGQRAAIKFQISRFVDGSCRREPDFEHSYPAITGLCRPGFSKKLKEGDKVIYLTNKKGIKAKYLVAILEVQYKIIGHQEAAREYQKMQILSLPNNLMVSETKPFPLNKTHRMGSWNTWANTVSLYKWNADYANRAEDNPHVAICKKMPEVNFENPILVTSDDLSYVFQRMPCTQNPPELKPEEWVRFQKRILGK